jgi:CDP-paratose 2-epimerase
MNAPAIVGLRPILITGGAGFLGSNLADRLAREGRHVVLFDSLRRPGAERNARWLRERHPERISLQRSDIRDEAAARAAVNDASAVFHFAAQVAVTTSLSDPAEDFAINVGGAFGLLEAIRRQGGATPFIFASTNKVYGDLADIALVEEKDCYLPQDAAIRASGVSEKRPLDFHTPYGCSKGAADQYALDYARSFGLPVVVMRMSCVYGPRQIGCEDQGWIAHFLIRALRGEPITIFGDGKQVRDVLYVDDAVNAYIAALRNIQRVRGRAFNLGGGPANAVSLRTLIAFIEGRLGRPVDIHYDQWRLGDQRYYVSNAQAVERELGLRQPLPWREGVGRLIDWLRSDYLPSSASARHWEAAE